MANICKNPKKFLLSDSYLLPNIREEKIGSVALHKFKCKFAKKRVQANAHRSKFLHYLLRFVKVKQQTHQWWFTAKKVLFVYFSRQEKFEFWYCKHWWESSSCYKSKNEYFLKKK